MKILWLCNLIPAPLALELHRPVHNIGGWLNVLIDTIKKNPDYDLTILFPISKKEEVLQGKTKTISYYSFFQNTKRTEYYDSELELFFETVLENVTPDIVHIWGSEYPHTLAMTNACEKKGYLQHTVISIQGLVSICAKHYYANLPEKIVKGKTFRDLVKWNGLLEAKKLFDIRGIHEIKALQKIPHVIGRTEWDLACTQMINPNITYHQGHEILRTSFYEGMWKLENCEKHSIFISQWGYPLKGFHVFLEAFKIVLKDYPDAKVITTGKDLFHASKKVFLKQTYYEKYIIKLIKKWGLAKNIIFLGKQLNEAEMKAQYLSAHIFVLPSAIENSPNSLGEAMLLGTPAIASNVGGISSMLTHGKEGFSYPFDEPYMLAYYIKRIFQDDALAKSFSIAERLKAAETHHIQNNINEYYQIYETISK